MPAKTYIGEIEDAAREFYATIIRGEISDANVQGYLRAASQIEDVWQETDQKLAELIAQGIVPWEAYEQLRYLLAFIRAAHTYQVFVRELLAADVAADPATADYLPRVTYDQANALCHQIQPNLQRAIAALHDASYVSDVSLPLELGPRIEAEGGTCPVAHLQGMINAAREVRDWAAGLIARYRNDVSQTPEPSSAPLAPAARSISASPAVTAHAVALESRLAQADSQLRFGEDLVGQVSQGEATPELHEQAENSLWDALATYFLLNQSVAMPELLQGSMPSRPTTGAAGALLRHQYRDRPIHPADLWRIAAPSALSELRGTEFGSDEMNEMCDKMGGVLSAGAQQYLDEVDAAVARGDAYAVAAMANCPFEPLYRARLPLDIAGAHISAGHEFHRNAARKPPASVGG